jgi:hypothetical protein
VSTTTPAAAGRQARSAAREFATNPWGERALRVGIASRGVVFVVLAYLVARIALGALGDGGTSKAASGPGVAEAIGAQTGGRLVLVLLGVGLLLYAVFSLLEAVRENDSSNVKRWGKRARSVWQMAVYASFGVLCIVKAASLGGSSGSSSHSNRQQEQWSARVLRWPAGWFWLGLLGVVLFVIAGAQVYGCLRRHFMKDLDQVRMSERMRRAAVAIGVAGHLGRAAAFALVGWFVLQAAIENDPQKGRGVDGSARMLASSSGGPALLWALAVGLALFGIHQFVEARFRRL